MAGEGREAKGLRTSCSDQLRLRHGGHLHLLRRRRGHFCQHVFTQGVRGQIDVMEEMEPDSEVWSVLRWDVCRTLLGQAINHRSEQTRQLELGHQAGAL